MTKLSVNINKIATLRNSRGGDVPSVEKVALDAQRFGAQGITVHPRPDERHIRYADVRQLAPLLTTEFNIEGYPTPDFIDLVCSVRPAQVTLVPDAPDAITSNAGWQTVEFADFLSPIIARFQSLGIRVSLFVDPDLDMVRGAKAVRADRIELYTESFATAFAAGNGAQAVEPFVAAARLATELGLGINAGHDLSKENLRFFAQSIGSTLDEVSIGHALIADALYLGLENTIQIYRRCLEI